VKDFERLLFLLLVVLVLWIAFAMGHAMRWW
jgi:hypothetical protein